MAKKHLGADLENLDVRVTTVEQILPTLTTKTDLREAVAPLTTKAELATAVALLATKAELAAAVAPLATKAELAAGLNGLRDELGTQMRTLHESARGDIHLLADSVLALHTKVDALAQKGA